jgi:hypothetical protein
MLRTLRSRTGTRDPSLMGTHNHIDNIMNNRDDIQLYSIYSTLDNITLILITICWLKMLGTDCR